ncbi:MAG: 50S ribosomal protein L24 [Acidobacteriota bacterium]|nr:50S ribosomal protein L24 [Acidobacteriota bacterium]
MAAKIKKGDKVEIIAGKDKGERGTVLRVFPKKDKVIVEELNMVKKHQRPGQNREGGIVDQEAPVHISNVMVVDPNDDRPCRVRFEIRDGKKTRVSKRTGAVLD